MARCTSVLVSTLLSLIVAVLSVNTRPIIGILTQPATKDYHPERIGESFLVASYVKFIEMSGARVVPIPFNAPKAALLKIFNSVNGILFTGGALDLKEGTDYFDNSLYLHNLALEANKKGDYFPLWGTCQGFQLFHVFAAGLKDENLVMEHFDSWDVSYPINFHANAKNSKMFGKKSGITDALLHDMATQAVTLNYHHLGVSHKTYKKFPKIDQFFRILATNKDQKGVEFISIVEAKDYPFYGVQFHPEWPIFEWDDTVHASHSATSINVNSYFSKFFVNECRNNTHKYANPKDEMYSLIYNYTPEYSALHGGDDDDLVTYFWKL
jgi:gamma-glutamyl hydrolase